jgi:hypothetical protein
MTQLSLTDLGWLGVIALVGSCGASQTLPHDFVETLHLTRPTLAQGQIHQAIQAIVPRGEDASRCQIRITWEGSSRRGQSEWLAPDEADSGSASWQVDLDVTEPNVVRTAGFIRCGDQRRPLPERFMMSDAGRRQYCELCPDLVSSSPAIEVNDPHDGIAVFVRPGVRARAQSGRLVDTCHGRVLLNAADFTGIDVLVSADSEEEEARLLFHREEACTPDAIVAGGAHVESADYVPVLEHLGQTAGVARVEDAAPPPPSR